MMKHSADSLAQLTGAIVNMAQQTMTPINPISSPNDVVIVRNEMAQRMDRIEEAQDTSKRQLSSMEDMLRLLVTRSNSTAAPHGAVKMTPDKN